MKVLITMTGIEEANAEEQGAAFMENHPRHEFSPEFAPYRCVVERDIGRLQMHSKFIVGPIHITQSDLLDDYLVLYSALVNKELDANKNFFVRPKAEGLAE